MSTTPELDSSSIDAVLESAVDYSALAGVAATVGNSAGVLYEGAFGVRDVGTSQPMTVDTVMWIASMTKAITGTAAMQLVEQGKLNLDDPVSETVPKLGEVQVLEGFDSEGDPILREPASQITLRQLLTHTAGFGYEIWSESLARYQEATGTPSVTTCEKSALELPLLFDPGTEWMYGINIDWVGQIVEAVSGQTLGAYFDQNILHPLGMYATSFRPSDDMKARSSSVHARDEEGALTVFPFAMPDDPEFEMGGGGLYSTVTDYLRFTRALLNGGTLDGERILSEDTVTEMEQNHIGDINVVTLQTAIPGFSIDANFFPDMDQKWGLSFLVNPEETKQGRSAGSVAWAGLANSYYWIDPHKDVCGVWATQLVPFADEIAMQNFRDFEQAVYASL